MVHRLTMYPKVGEVADDNRESPGKYKYNAIVKYSQFKAKIVQKVNSS